MSKKASPKTQATITKRPAAANLEASAIPVDPKPETQWVEVDADELALLDGSPSFLYVDPQLLSLAANGGQEACHSAFDILGRMSEEEIRLVRRAIFRLEDWCDSYLVGNGR